MLRDDRAASSVLAVVLMMGFVAAASVSLFVVGSASLAESTQQTQDAQVESTFLELNKDVSSVAYGRQKYRETDFNIKSNTAAFRQENTGNIQVIVDGNTIVDRDVGALVYQDSGSTIAYQAGGIWANKGKDSRLVSSPPVEYQNGSLTFPIPSLEGDETVQAGKLSIKKMGTEAPINDVGYIEGKLVTLKIKSEYYMGWAQYFRTQTNNVAVSVDHSPAGDTGIVTVKLGRPLANGNFQDGVMATGGADGHIRLSTGSPEIDGPVGATGDITYSHPADITGDEDPNMESDLYELDDGIEQKVEIAQGNASWQNVDLENGHTTLTGGNLYFDDDGFALSDSGDTVEVDLSSGNVTLVVDGDMELTDADIEVDDGGTDHALRIYSTGDFGMKNTFAGDDTDLSDQDASSAKHLQIYGTSEMLVGLQGGSTRFVGTIYAPRNEPALESSEPNTALPSSNSDCNGWDTCVVKGSTAIKGAIVAGPTNFEQGAGMEYDNSLANVQPTLELSDGVLPPPITFLKVAVHKVAVNNSDNQRIVPAGGLGSPALIDAPGTVSAVHGSGAVAAPRTTVAAPTRRF